MENKLFDFYLSNIVLTVNYKWYELCIDIDNSTFEAIVTHVSAESDMETNDIEGADLSIDFHASGRIEVTASIIGENNESDFHALFINGKENMKPECIRGRNLGSSLGYEWYYYDAVSKKFITKEGKVYDGLLADSYIPGFIKEIQPLLVQAHVQVAHTNLTKVEEILEKSPSDILDLTESYEERKEHIKAIYGVENPTKEFLKNVLENDLYNDKNSGLGNR